MRVRASARIAIFVAAVGLIAWGANLYQQRRILGLPTPPIPPGKFTLLGLKPDENYNIFIAGDTAYITVGSALGTFAGSHSGGANQGSRVPTADLLAAKGGDVAAMGRLVTRLTEDLRLDPEKTPNNPVPWTQEDVEKALSGDAALRPKLSADLALRLDPKDPAPPLTLSAIDNGIMVRVLVPVICLLPEGRVTVMAPVYRPFRSRAALAVEEETKEKPLPPDTTVALYKKLAAEPEDVPAALRSLYAKAKLVAYAAAATDILDKTFIVITEKHATGASMTEVPAAPPHTRPTYDLHVGLTDEGRARLYKFSTQYGGNRVLVIFSGAALGASTLTEGLDVSEFYISKLPDKRLVQGVVELLQGRKSNRK